MEHGTPQTAKCLLCPRPRAKDCANNPKDAHLIIRILIQLIVVLGGTGGVIGSVKVAVRPPPHGSRVSIMSTAHVNTCSKIIAKKPPVLCLPRHTLLEPMHYDPCALHWVLRCRGGAMVGRAQRWRIRFDRRHNKKVSFSRSVFDGL